MKRAEPGWLIVALAGVAALIGSFLPFYTYARGIDVTVWSRGLFPTAALLPILGSLLALEALFVLVMGFEPRSPFLNFTWEQVRIGTGAFMMLLALSYLVQDRAGGSFGVGYVVVALASVATFAGGVMTRRAEIARAPGEKAPARGRTLRPLVATLRRWGGELTGNAAALGRNAKAQLGFGEANERKQEAEEPARVATLSAVHTETETETETKPASDATPSETGFDREAQPVETQAAETQAAEAKTAETKPAETTTADTKPIETTTADAKPAGTEPIEPQPAETKTTETTTADTKPIEPQPAETKTAETTTADTKPTETTTADTNPAETTTADEEPAEPKPAKLIPKKPPPKAAPKKPAAATPDTPADAKIETDGESERDEAERRAAPGSGGA